MHFNNMEISTLIRQRIDQFDLNINTYDEGIVIYVADGIIRIYGLDHVMLNEVVILSNGSSAIVLNLEREFVSAVVMGSYLDISEGMKVKTTGKVIQVPVGRKLLGRVINALGVPIDNSGKLEYEYFSNVESPAPGVIDRVSVSEPMLTGYKAIDAMIPIGQGQRELIIGDRQTGKTTLAIDSIINQKNSGIKCIYVAIGQKASTVVNTVNILKKYHVLDNTIVVVANASEPAILQYLAPYTGCTMGEYFRNIGENALIVYDDLSKQAIAYRQISLLLRRPPGREAYPGDIFYLHARLLERAARVSINYVETFTNGKIKNKTGSLTALPIIETQVGDVSSFIPTNLISITDGQIFLESNLFNAGIRPAINPGISVSRVGSAAQTSIIKFLSKGIRNKLAQYRELIAFSQFSSDLDSNTRAQIKEGQNITELLKQSQYNPYSVAQQVIVLFLVEYKYLNDILVKNISNFENKLLAYFNNYHYDFLKHINTKLVYNDNIKNKLHDIINNFKNNYYK
ncbi:MAG: F0F1 ATP synthase subunit alpha [Candidatus Lightella neohaematopini]|nr:F0F1 ATP synthase subunit alpha [Candidatus Lightella neohaematopini]